MVALCRSSRLAAALHSMLGGEAGGLETRRPTQGAPVVRFRVLRVRAARMIYRALRYSSLPKEQGKQRRRHSGRDARGCALLASFRVTYNNRATKLSLTRYTWTWSVGAAYLGHGAVSKGNGKCVLSSLPRILVFDPALLVGF